MEDVRVDVMKFASNRNAHAIYTVHYQVPSEQQPIAILVWHHGYGEHVGRMHRQFQTLAKAGIAVHSYDAYGHGRSEPKDKDRGIVWAFDDLVDDVYTFYNLVTKDMGCQRAPVFLGGQSMGGLVAAHAALRSPGTWAGLILHSAALDVEWTPVLRAQAAVGGVLARLIPRARIVPAVRPEDMSQDPQVVKDYVEDPLNIVGNLPARTGTELLNAFRALGTRYEDFRLPIYAAHGTHDHCTSLAAVQRFMQRASSRDKVLNRVQGGYHELLMGPESEECLERLILWIKQRAAPASRL